MSVPNTVDEWSAHFQSIYGPSNEHSPWYRLAAMLGCHLCLLLSPKYTDSTRFQQFRWQLAKSFAWLFAIHNHKAKPTSSRHYGPYSDISMLLLSEFPDSCPYCGENPCNERDNEHESGRRRDHRTMNCATARRLAQESGAVRRFSLEGWAGKVLQIYPNNRDRSLPDLAGKVAEEYAELMQALDAYSVSDSPVAQCDVREETADLFCRLCVYARRVLDSHGFTESIDSLVWSIYDAGCPMCAASHPQCLECTCKQALNRNQQQLSLYGPTDRSTPAQSSGPISININNRVESASSASALSESTSKAVTSASALAEVFETAKSLESDHDLTKLVSELARLASQSEATEREFRPVVEVLHAESQRLGAPQLWAGVKAYLAAVAVELGASAAAESILNWISAAGLG